MRQLWKTGLSSLTLATLWLYPLINALSDEADWLHWRTHDTFETMLAWVLLAAAFAAALGLVERRHHLRLAEGLTAIFLGVAGIAVVGAMVRLSWWSEFASSNRALAPWIGAAALAAYLGMAAFLTLPQRRAARRPLRHLTLMLSPVILVMAFNIGAANLRQLQPPPERIGLADQAAGTAAPKPLTVILLFDELSADLFYKPASAGPASARFIRQATIYGSAYLPGGSTDKAIPALFLGTNGDPYGTSAKATSIVSELAASGRDVRVWGWYLDYCAGFASAAARCHAVSSYNARTLDDSFSPLHPLWTTLNLLPSTPPFDTFKAGPAVQFHRQTLRLAQQWLARQIADASSDVVYVHVNVPHVPYLGDGSEVPNGRARFVMTPERYVAQLKWVDQVLGQVMQEVSQTAEMRASRVIVLSDHNARAIMPSSQHEHVVFAVRDSPAPEPRQIGVRAHAGDLLRAELDRH